LDNSVWMGSVEGVEFVIHSFREVFNMGIMVECKVKDVIRGIRYFT
jgi:hypothetical protein